MGHVVSLGHCNNYHRPNGLYNRDLFLTVLEAVRKFKMKVLEDSVFCEHLLLGLRMATSSLYPQMVEKRLLVSLFLEGY